MEILVIIWFISRNDQWSESVSVMSNSLQPHGLYSPWNSPSQNAGVGSHSLLQRIFPTQESNWGLLHCRWILYQLSCQPGEFHGLYNPWDRKEWDMAEWFHFIEMIGGLLKVQGLFTSSTGAIVKQPDS